MKCLLLHNRRSSGPKESSWWTFHYILEELKKRNILLGNYSFDFNLTDDNEISINDRVLNEADCFIMSFTNAEGPLQIAQIKNNPSFVEINYACPEIVNVLMQRELSRLKFSSREIEGEPKAFGNNFYSLPTYIFGAGNSYTENTYKSFGLNKVKMFKAGIDHDFFVPNFSERKKNGKIKFTFTCATMNFRKGAQYVCDAWENLPADYHKKIELHLFGNRSSGPNTKKLIEKLVAQYNNVFEHGFISNQNPDYIKIHAEADSMICPTLAEGQSATALEGMSFGLYPIVSPFTGSDFEKLPGRVLSLDPSTWSKEICSSICYVVDEYNAIANIAPLIRKHAIEEYKWESYRKAVVDFIEQEYKFFYSTTRI